MIITKCENGHYYDIEKYSVCPQCVNEGKASPDAGLSAAAPAGYGETLPLGGDYGAPSAGAAASYGETLPLGGGGFADDMSQDNVTQPVTEGFRPDFAGQSGVEDYSGMTEPVYINQSAGFSPVVGWLVCVDGPERGKDYRIKPGYNFIGREERMDICLRGDSKVSGYRDSAIAYDDESKSFYFGHQNGMNPVKVNGKPVINQVELKEHDVITIGSTKLIFVPLCGEKFSW